MSRRERTRLLTSLAIAAAVGIILACLYTGLGRYKYFITIEQSTQDLFFARDPDPERYGDVRSRYVIVALDGKSLSQLGRWTNWDRSVYARVLDFLRAADALTVVFDFGFLEAGPGDDELA